MGGSESGGNAGVCEAGPCGHPEQSVLSIDFCRLFSPSRLVCWSEASVLMWCGGGVNGAMGPIGVWRLCGRVE